MREVVILIPETDPEQNVEIEVRINGRSKTIQYRVELVSWEGSESSPEEKFTVLKHRIDAYDKDWELVEIGVPEPEKIPLVFRRRILKENQA
ncbi:MAG: hypothetical protein V1775_11895 [Bacteroidota bacterium]